VFLYIIPLGLEIFFMVSKTNSIINIYPNPSPSPARRGREQGKGYRKPPPKLIPLPV
jgi:hypothetical protein